VGLSFEPRFANQTTDQSTLKEIIMNKRHFFKAALAFAFSAAASITNLAQAQDAKPSTGKVQVQWLGQAAFKITTVAGKVIVIDPWLITNPKTPEAFRKLDALGKVDLVLVTHGHFDHFADAPALAKMNNAPFWGPAGLAQSMQVLGILPVAQANRMNKGGSITPFGANFGANAGVRITMTRAEHSSELLWRNPATDKDELHVGGEPCGFLIEFENGFKLMGDIHKPDLLLMPIGGGQFVMNPVDAAYAARDLIKPKAVIPMHYGTNPSLVGTPAEFSKALGASAIKVLAIQPGEMLEF
jgi:L-ascorbate metabolism protein UlaG (beta-lactamase superfamily)